MFYLNTVNLIMIKYACNQQYSQEHGKCLFLAVFTLTKTHSCDIITITNSEVYIMALTEKSEKRKEDRRKEDRRRDDRKKDDRRKESRRNGQAAERRKS